MGIVSSAFRHGRSNGQACRNGFENRLDRKVWGACPRSSSMGHGIAGVITSLAQKIPAGFESLMLHHLIIMPVSYNGDVSRIIPDFQSGDESSILSTGSISARLAEGISICLTCRRRWFDSNTEYHILDSYIGWLHCSDKAKRIVRLYHRGPFIFIAGSLLVSRSVS